MAYKSDQGRLARMAIFWILWILIVYGCWGLRYAVKGWGLPTAITEALTTLPVIEEVSYASLFVLILIPAVVAFVLIHALNRPKFADFLIETENELRKVAWPSFKETRQASLVVVITVLILAGFLAGSDAVLSRLVALLIYKG